MPRSCPVDKYSDTMPLIIVRLYTETDHIKEHYVTLQTESEDAFSNIISKFIAVKPTTSVDDSHIKLESLESLKTDDTTVVIVANESQSSQSQNASATANLKRKRTFQHWIAKYPWFIMKKRQMLSHVQFAEKQKKDAHIFYKKG